MIPALRMSLNRITITTGRGDGLEVEPMSRNPEGRGSIPRLGSRMSSLISQPAAPTFWILVSHPCFSKFQVFTSIMRSDHKAIIASGSNTQVSVPSEKIKRAFWPRLLSQHADFLNHLRTEIHDLLQTESEDVQAEFDRFYRSTLMLLDKFYPEKLLPFLLAIHRSLRLASK